MERSGNKIIVAHIFAGGDEKIVFVCVREKERGNEKAGRGRNKSKSTKCILNVNHCITKLSPIDGELILLRAQFHAKIACKMSLYARRAFRYTRR